MDRLERNRQRRHSGRYDMDSNARATALISNEAQRSAVHTEDAAWIDTEQRCAGIGWRNLDMTSLPRKQRSGMAVRENEKLQRARSEANRSKQEEAYT